MKQRIVGAALVALICAACGQASMTSSSAPGEEAAGIGDTATSHVAALPEVDAALLASANGDFTAIEPSELGVIAAPTVEEALGPLLSTETTEGDQVVQLSVREQGDAAIADVVRLNIPDDAVSGGHLRVEFTRGADGWDPVNAYRRMQCRRGASAGQWGRGPCP